MEIQKKPLSNESIQKILDYLPYFSNKNTFGQWKSNEVQDNISTFPHLSYSKRVLEFKKLLYDTNFTVIFDWGSWNKGREIMNNKDRIMQSDLLTLRMLITAILRNERFNEGSLLSRIEDKTIQTILVRLKEL